MSVMILADIPPPAGIPLSARANGVLHRAIWCAHRDGSDFVGTEHLAQALLEEEEGPHVEVLRRNRQEKTTNRRPGTRG